jgi:hypothetical protein
MLRRGEKINGVRKRRGYINGWGKKRGLCIGGGKNNGVLEERWVRSTAVEPGTEKLTDVYS